MSGRRCAAWPAHSGARHQRAVVAGSLGLSLLLLPQIAAAQNAGGSDGGAVLLDTVEVQGTSSVAPVDTPPGTVGYVTTQSSVGTKTATPVIEIPQSISTITRQQLNDRNVQTVIQAVGYTPGVTAAAYGFDPRFDGFYIRGFDVTYNGIYRDGLRQGGAVFAIPRIEPYGVQDISILRGPSSGLYGLSSSGGVVDVTTKRPTNVAFGEVQLQGGEYDRYQGNIDIGGPVPGSDQLSYRLTGLLRDSDTWLPGAKDNRAYIAPAVTWRPDEDTSITLLSEYLSSRTTGSSFFYNRPDGRITKYYSNDPAYGAQDQEQYRVGYALEHRFDDLLTVRQNFRYYHVDTDAKYTQIDSIDKPMNAALRSTGRVLDSYDNVTLDNQAELHLATGPVSHTVLAGVSYQHSYLNDRIGFGTAPDLNLEKQNYGAQYIPPITHFVTHVKQWQDEVGVYGQEQAKFGGFIVTLGGQQSWVKSTSDDLKASTSEEQNNTAFTGRAGLAYLFDNGVAPYVSYSTSFAPQLGVDSRNRPFAPTSGEQKEVGVKYQMPNTNVLLTGALFDITQDNVLRIDPNNSSYQSSTGQVESKGLELEATVNFAPGTNLTAAYTHMNVKITEGDPDTTGNYFSGIPTDTFSTFGKYTFQSDSPLEGFGIGAGVRYVGSSWGNDQNTFKNKDVAFVDAVVDYDFARVNPKLKGLKAQVNASNLFDTRHVQCQGGYCYRDDRRNVIASLIYRW